MKFHTHGRTPKPKYKEPVYILLGVLYGLFIFAFLFSAIICSIYAGSFAPATVILTTMFLIAALMFITQKDMDKAYVEVDNDVITVVDYYCDIKKEKIFSVQDIGYAEILAASSVRIRGYVHNISCISYIVFRDIGSKYMFKIICLPERKEFFGKYLK